MDVEQFDRDRQTTSIIKLVGALAAVLDDELQQPAPQLRHSWYVGMKTLAAVTGWKEHFASLPVHQLRNIK